MMWRRVLSIGLALALSCAPLSALPQPSAPSPSVTLSPDEYAQIVAAMESARASLERSNQIIESQSKSLTRLSILCGVLAGVLVIDAIAQTRFAFSIK
jgi:hypothetical protein